MFLLWKINLGVFIDNEKKEKAESFFLLGSGKSVRWDRKKNI